MEREHQTQLSKRRAAREKAAKEKSAREQENTCNGNAKSRKKHKSPPSSS